MKVTKHHLGRLIDHVHLRVADVETSKRFYLAVVGSLGRRDSLVEGGGFELGLLPRATPGADGPQPLWGVAAIEAAYSRTSIRVRCAEACRSRSKMRALTAPH